MKFKYVLTVFHNGILKESSFHFTLRSAKNEKKYGWDINKDDKDTVFKIFRLQEVK